MNLVLTTKYGFKTGKAAVSLPEASEAIIPAGRECEVLAMWGNNTLVIKDTVTEMTVNQVPCDIFGLEPDDVKFLIECSPADIGLEGSQ